MNEHVARYDQAERVLLDTSLLTWNASWAAMESYKARGMNLIEAMKSLVAAGEDVLDHPLFVLAWALHSKVQAHALEGLTDD